MRILRTSAALTAAALVGLVFSAASPAGASTTSATRLSFAAANATSTGQAGYEVTTAPAKSSASATFTVPAAKGCTSTASGIAAGSLIFTGSGSTASISGVGVFIECNGGAPAYAAVAVVNGTGTQLAVTISPGDVVTTSSSVTATKVKVSFKDTTKNFAKTLSGAGAVSAVVLDGIDSLVQGTTQLPVPNFKKISYSAGLEDGKTPKAAGAIAVDMATAATPPVLQIKTGPLSATGNAWTETFKHA